MPPSPWGSYGSVGSAVGIAVNGMPEEQVHHQRILELLTAMYAELDLA